MKSKLKYILLIVLVLFIAYNFIWYFGIYKVYSGYEKDFPVIEDSGVKIYVDNDEYQYSVNKPSYLLWDGNLAVAEKDIKHGLIIWLDFGGKRGCEGVILTNNSGEMKQIELIKRDKAKNEVDQDIVDENRDTIDLLYEKAEDIWNLEMD